MDRKRHIAIVAGLLALSCVVQLLLIRRATVPALDAVGFVEIAQRIDAQGFLATIRHEREQPLFPAWVWLVHEGLERTAGPARASWAASVQLAAAIPLVLAVVPVYFLSLGLVGPAPAAAGSLFFCLLPEVSRLGADGLGDGLHLLLFCLAFWAVVVYLARPVPCQSPRNGLRVTAFMRSGAGRSPMWLVVAGTLAALAVLVRAEALVLPAALVVALLAFRLRARRRRPWSALATALGCLALGLSRGRGGELSAHGRGTDSGTLRAGRPSRIAGSRVGDRGNRRERVAAGRRRADVVRPQGNDGQPPASRLRGGNDRACRGVGRSVRIRDRGVGPIWSVATATAARPSRRSVRADLLLAVRLGGASLRGQRRVRECPAPVDLGGDRSRPGRIRGDRARHVDRRPESGRCARRSTIRPQKGAGPTCRHGPKRASHELGPRPFSFADRVGHRFGGRGRVLRRGGRAVARKPAGPPPGGRVAGPRGGARAGNRHPRLDRLVLGPNDLPVRRRPSRVRPSPVGLRGPGTTGVGVRKPPQPDDRASARRRGPARRHVSRPQARSPTAALGGRVSVGGGPFPAVDRRPIARTSNRREPTCPSPFARSSRASLRRFA